MNAKESFPILACALVLVCATSPLWADFTFGEPVDLRSTIPVIDPMHESIDCISSDGLEIYIVSDRPGGSGVYDIWVVKRATVDSEWNAPENLGPAVNSAGQDNGIWISADGLTLHFASNRSGGHGSFDMYKTTRATKADPWGPAVNLGPVINSPAADGDAWIAPDGLELYVSSRRSGGYGSGDIYVARRATTADSWSELVNLGPTINSAHDETALCLSPDGLLLLYSDNFEGGTAPRPGGHGGSDMWMTRRATVASPWQPSVNLGLPVNSSVNEIMPYISRDGSALYFVTYSGGVWDNWQAPILPVVDFNGDTKVDAADMGLLVDTWGMSESVCDVGPFPWGDGVVDEKDLKVIMGSVMSPGPKAADVPCDVVLGWEAPSFADGFDVYFGTSLEDVRNATRDDPCGVLVGLGQAETTYDPDGNIEFSRQYYWRVDTVAGPAEGAIYPGPVLSFTAEDFAYPIQNVIATASSAQPGMGPDKAVDGSGLDAGDGHSTKGEDMWLTRNAGAHWIQFEFDETYTLHELWVWNSNQLIEPMLGFGARTVGIEYSTDGATWFPLEDVPEFAKAPGKPGYTPNTVVIFGGVVARYVKLNIESNWGGVAQQTGLSEVRFFHIPDRSSSQP